MCVERGYMCVCVHRKSEAILIVLALRNKTGRKVEKESHYILFHILLLLAFKRANVKEYKQCRNYFLPPM